MFANALLLAAAFQAGPLYEQRAEYRALRPFYSEERETVDVLWPVFTKHRDWWRFCFFTHYQRYPEGGYQFEIMPIWFQGAGKGKSKGERVKSAEDDFYWGLFPLWGHHPHIALMYDVDFALWPLWHRYRMPASRETNRRVRPADEWMTSNSVLFPFFHWRSDGSWGFWPFYGISHNRADDSQYVLWPLFNWKTQFPDRDTGGEGHSWMFWPLAGRVDREREQQWLFLPPFFSYVETPDGWRGRYPLPFVEIERFRKRSRTSVFPFYESIHNFSYKDDSETTSLRRYGWRLVEDLPDEFRVFPFWVSRPDDAYFRLWPFYESERLRLRGPGNGRVDSDLKYSRFLSLFPIRWVDSVDRNWAKFWTFYESVGNPRCTYHSLFWGLINWSTAK